MSDEHLNLKLDLGRKVKRLIDEHDDPAAATGEILDLLELESARSYLTGADYAQIMSGVGNIVGLARDHAVAEGDDATILAYRLEHELYRLRKRLHGLTREAVAS